MYEDKRRKIKIDWKSVFIKMAILLVVIFLIIWIISIVNKKDKKEVPSNLSTNLKTMQTAALEYFTISKLPENVNGRVKLTLDQMIKDKLIIEFKDQNGKACSMTESYAEATKISANEYTIKVKLVCSKETDYVIDTIKLDDNENNNPNEGNVPSGDTNIDPGTTDNQGSTTNQGGSTNQGTTTNQGSGSNNTKPSTGNTSKPSGSTNTKPSTGSSTSNNNASSSGNNKPNSGVTTSSCAYGSKEYSAFYPLAYVIEGNCAVSKSDYYNAKYADKATSIGVTEYRKIYNETVDLGDSTNTNLFVEQPVYSPVYNKAGTGLVGYQIKFVVKQKLTYTSKIIYEYYLTTSGTRKVVIDNRSSLKFSGSNTGDFGNNNNNSGNTGNNSGNTGNNNYVGVSSITLSKYSVTLEIGEKYTLVPTVNPSNATDKNVQFASNNSVVATVNSQGVVEARSEGVTYIKVSCGGKITNFTVYVVKSLTPETSVSLSPSSLNLTVGDSYTLKATVSPSSMAENVVYMTSNATVATVSQDGVVHAMGAGSCTIYARVDGKEARVSVTVIKPTPETSVSLSPSSLNLTVGESYTLRATVSPSSMAEHVVYMTSNATVATVSQDGVVHAMGAGSCTIYARVDGKEARVSVTVKAASTNVTKVTILDGDIHLRIGESRTLNYVVTPSEAIYGKTIYFYTSNKNVVAINNKAVITGVSKGSAIVSVTVDGYTALINVYVE